MQKIIDFIRNLFFVDLRNNNIIVPVKENNIYQVEKDNPILKEPAKLVYGDGAGLNFDYRRGHARLSFKQENV